MLLYIFSCEINNSLVITLTKERANICDFVFGVLDKVSKAIFTNQKEIEVAKHRKFSSFLEKAIFTLVESNLKKGKKKENTKMKRRFWKERLTCLSLTSGICLITIFLLPMMRQYTSMQQLNNCDQVVRPQYKFIKILNGELSESNYSD